MTSTVALDKTALLQQEGYQYVISMPEMTLDTHLRDAKSQLGIQHHIVVPWEDVCIRQQVHRRPRW